MPPKGRKRKQASKSKKLTVDEALKDMIKYFTPPVTIKEIQEGKQCNKGVLPCATSRPVGVQLFEQLNYLSEEFNYDCEWTKGRAYKANDNVIKEILNICMNNGLKDQINKECCGRGNYSTTPLAFAISYHRIVSLLLDNDYGIDFTCEPYQRLTYFDDKNGRCPSMFTIALHSKNFAMIAKLVPHMSFPILNQYIRMDGPNYANSLSFVWRECRNEFEIKNIQILEQALLDKVSLEDYTEGNEHYQQTYNKQSLLHTAIHDNHRINLPYTKIKQSVKKCIKRLSDELIHNLKIVLPCHMNCLMECIKDYIVWKSP